MKRLLMGLVLVLAAIGAGTLVALAVLLRDGISARLEPGTFETTAAARLRAWAIPAAAENQQNPVALTPEVLADGMAHWADHCAACHGNDGSGETTIGRGLYPRAPDMRLPATQELTDGTLFYIIEEGVKLTGMPAWGNGTREGEAASWHLVHFIRHLPKLSDDELERMKGMNPTPPARPHKHGGQE